MEAAVVDVEVVLETEQDTYSIFFKEDTSPYISLVFP